MGPLFNAVGASLLTRSPDRFTFIEAGRLSRTALLAGLAYGGAQDLLGVAAGRHIGYVDFLRRRFRSSGREVTAETSETPSAGQ